MINNKLKGGVLITIGYILSPLSWWNDIFINLPLAYVFGFLFGLISEKLFLPMVIFGYWITNVIGFMLMHYGIKNITFKQINKYTKKEVIKNVIISIIYTIIVILFVKIGWLKFSLEYFK